LLDVAGLVAGNPNFYFGIPDWTPEAAIGLEPIPDLFFKNALEFWMPYQRQQNEVALVHCSQGINRSATLAYAMMIAQGMSRVDSMVALNSHRAVTGLSDFLDHPWRENAEHALYRLGYVVR
jgi:protein-tyrosine phosphatase